MRVRFGSIAVIEYIPKAAIRAAGLGGIADLAIHRKQPFVSGKSWARCQELEWQVLAETCHPADKILSDCV